ncbi:phosphoglycolate phosphatase [Roseivivax lentus]|uniref:Phosphoglycolate phosphatase n=1 Tax=Roseivivax lentus TaxID=633194 RepID=A0A1N7M9T9_9RHOB|nr:HAD-IA family hydrolase [Roseivivax lentus]SIS82866.1 phosphoglycolate phosphatase [Roseivivax lentus]
MSADLRLVVFDVDGTLVDSQADIHAAMIDAFASAELAAPGRADVLGIVGLSLPEAMAELAPGVDAATRLRMVEAYKNAYATRRKTVGAAEGSPLFPGVRDVLDAVHAVPHWLPGIATGKSRRGLDALLDGHGLRGRFVTEQVSDHHPSKPHPAMLHAALSETGVAARHAVMVGDTEFDMAMARAAGMVAIGVTWGYHPAPRLAEAHHLIDDIAVLPALLKDIWGET